MAKLYIKNTDGTYSPYQSVVVSNLDIVQETGSSLTSAMSQKAVTDELTTKQDTIIDIETIRSNAQNASDVVTNMTNAGYLFAGVATPSTNPGTPEAKVFYIANGKGTYTNFGGLEVTEDEVVVLYYDTEWHKVATGIASQAKLSELEKVVVGVRKIGKVTFNNGGVVGFDAISIKNDGDYIEMSLSTSETNAANGFAFATFNGNISIALVAQVIGLKSYSPNKWMSGFNLGIGEKAFAPTTLRNGGTIKVAREGDNINVYINGKSIGTTPFQEIKFNKLGGVYSLDGTDYYWTGVINSFSYNGNGWESLYNLSFNDLCNIEYTESQGKIAELEDIVNGNAQKLLELEPKVEKAIIVDEKTETKLVVLANADFEENSGYITDNTFVSGGNFKTYLIDINKNGKIWVSKKNSESFFRVCVFNGTLESHTSSFYANVEEVPTSEANAVDITKGDKLAVTINTTGEFNVSYRYDEVKKYLPQDIFVKSIEDLSARIDNLATDSFILHHVNDDNFQLIKKENGKVLTHNFTHIKFTDNVAYSGGTKTLVTEDLWGPDQILVDGVYAIQGNLNFIYKVDSSQSDFANENSHVGWGHGCCVAKFQKFFADGKEVDISKPFDDIVCKSFRVISKADCYKIDTSKAGFSSAHALPYLDSSGNVIVTAVHTYDAEFVGNDIIWDNKLTIKRTGVKFAQLHGAMLAGNYTHFNMVTIGDVNFTTNKYERNESGDVVVTPIDDSVDMQTINRGKSNMVVMYGKGVVCRQEIEGRDSYTLSVFYNSATDARQRRLKVYLQPAKTTEHFGEEADTFAYNSEIRIKAKRCIDL